MSDWTKQLAAYKKASASKASQTPIKPPVKPTSTPVDRDHQLFLKHMRAVRRLSPDDRYQHPTGYRQPSEVQHQKRLHAEGAQELTPLKLKSDRIAAHSKVHETGYIAQSQQQNLLKQLQQGHWPVEACLDLHHHTIDSAWQQLNQFLQTAVEHHVRCVCVIHGKGYGSRQQQGVLKDQVQAWLRHFAIVLAYCTAPEHSGGSGAVLVLLEDKKYTEDETITK